MNDFPEDRFRPTHGLAEEYEKRIHRGRRKMEYRSVVVGGLVRQAGPGIWAALETMERIGKMFDDYRLVVYENDSTDGTSELLSGWWASNGPDRHAVCEVTGQPKWPSIRDHDRGVQMAEYREKLRTKMVEVGGNGDYAVVLDTDLAAYSMDGLANSFGFDEWDAMGSLGLKRHSSGRMINYDVWAWRNPGHPDQHHWREINPLSWPRGHAPIPVWSCFGGMAAYRMDAFKSARYVGDGGGDHYRFHLGMREAGYGRVFCNPSQLTLYN